MTLPTRNHLHAAFQRRFRNSEYLEPILAGCAEVAEREFNRARLEAIRVEISGDQRIVHENVPNQKKQGCITL